MCYVLAMYDVRGKQEFIFRTNKLKEIAGGSWIIRDCFKDYLFPAAEKVSGGKCRGIFYYKNADGSEKEGAEFHKKEFEKHMADGYIGEVVYDGGGNFLLLYKNEEIFQNVTYAFTKSLMESVGTLRVLGTCVKVENFDDYKADQKKLYAAHRAHEMEESIISPWSCLPIVQVDRATSQPLTAPDTQAKGYNLLKQAEQSEKHTKESWAKLMKYREEMRRIEEMKKNGDKKSDGSADCQLSQNENIFDRLVPEKGVDSQLAVIYIDGNSMGAKVQDCLKDPAGNDLKSYESCVKKLREFSAEIQNTYVDHGIKVAMEGQEKGREHRIVVYAGDEVNFIVPAKDAYKCAKTYLTSLKEGNSPPNDYSACAGIAVFHSHFPYSEVYRIAEECCESGKKLMKEREIKDACLIDFHIIQGAAGVSLDRIREQENGRIISRPWLFSVSEEEKGKAEGITKTEDAERLAGMFRELGRGNIKGLAELAKRGSAGLDLDLMRIKSHQPEEIREKMRADWEWLSGMDDTRKRRLVFDVVQV